MRFDASAEQQELAGITRRFLEETVPLAARRLLGEKSPAGFDRDWWRRAAGLGWTSLLVPEHLGGSGGSEGGLAELAIVAEEQGRLVAPGPLLPTSVSAWTLAQAEQTDVVRRALDAMNSGEGVCAWVRGHDDGPWPQSLPAVRAVRTNDTLSLTGVDGAVEAGADAEYLLVAVCLDEQVAHVLVEATPAEQAEQAGLRRRRLSSLDLVRRQAELTFDGMEISGAAIVIEGDRGRAVLRRQGQLANVLQCAEMVGAAARTLEMCLDYAAERSSFGRPLASYQVLKHRFADMKLWLEASAAAVEGAVAAVADDAPDAAERVSAAKLYVGRKATDIVQDCIQVHGGIGVTWEHDLHLYLRRVTVDRQLMGTPAEHTEHLANLIGL
jgi:alkylation response protein AidB-like acyl-CoA dehydrogenase